MFTDQYNRHFSYLRLSVTDVCNFKCQYCLPNGYQRPENPAQFLALNEIDKLVSTFVSRGTNKIRITGGEPTLRRDIDEIIRCVSRHPGVDIVAMTTNAYRLADNAAKWQQAGLTRVNISIDSFDERLFNQITGTKRFAKVMAGVEAAISCGLEVKLNAVLMRHYNFSQFDSILDRLRQWPVEIRFIELMETLEQRELFHQEHVSGTMLKEHLLSLGWQALPRANNAGPAQVFSHPQYRGKIGLILPYEQHFCADCNRLRISALGKLHLCLFGEHGYELRPWLGNDSSEEQLAEQIDAALMDKRKTHFLHDNNPGETLHLASVGG